jgi:1,5-anhydro-D-fructose reductase (1,5-anhydro-D-mannitol-forming)
MLTNGPQDVREQNIYMAICCSATALASMATNSPFPNFPPQTVNCEIPTSLRSGILAARVLGLFYDVGHMIRYGIAGFGLHAIKRLMPGFSASENSRAVALSRRNFAQAQADAVQYGVQAFATTRQLCESPDVDAVFVSSPNSIHLEDVLTAIEHGKHVLCEKPMAVDASEAEQMVSAAHSRGVHLGVAQCFRFCETLARIRHSVQCQEIGHIISIRIDFSFPGVNSARRWLHNASLAGGGPIADVGVHCLDAMRYILADEPLTCSALTAHDEHSGTVESSAVLSLRFSRDTLGSSFVSFRAPYRTIIDLTGTEGSIVARDGLNVDWPVTVEIRTSSGVRKEEMSNASAYARQVDAFSATIESGSEFPATAEDGLQNQRILDALYLSSRTHHEVEIVSN